MGQGESWIFLGVSMVSLQISSPKMILNATVSYWIEPFDAFGLHLDCIWCIWIAFWVLNMLNSPIWKSRGRWKLILQIWNSTELSSGISVGSAACGKWRSASCITNARRPTRRHNTLVPSQKSSWPRWLSDLATFWHEEWPLFFGKLWLYN